jgi:hypothetical protein
LKNTASEGDLISEIFSLWFQSPKKGTKSQPSDQWQTEKKLCSGL